MSYLCYLCLFVLSGVQHILCYVFALFFSSCTLWCQFLWIVLYSMVPVSLDYPFFIVPSVFSNIYLQNQFSILTVQHLKQTLSMFH